MKDLLARALTTVTPALKGTALEKDWYYSDGGDIYLLVNPNHPEWEAFGYLLIERDDGNVTYSVYDPEGTYLGPKNGAPGKMEALRITLVVELTIPKL